jgi:hypothetical protein
MLWSRAIVSSSHSGFLGRVHTLGRIGPMALFLFHRQCQHYYESGQPREACSDAEAVARAGAGGSRTASVA